MSSSSSPVAASQTAISITDPSRAEALLGAELGDAREPAIALAQLLGPYPGRRGRARGCRRPGPHHDRVADGLASERTAVRARTVLRRLQDDHAVPEVAALLADHGHRLTAPQ